METIEVTATEFRVEDPLPNRRFGTIGLSKAMDGSQLGRILDSQEAAYAGRYLVF